MNKLGIALDLGTSGFRGQALDLGQEGMIISTAVSTRHPLPGANVMDHLHFAIEVGLERAHQVVVQAINRIIDQLDIQKERVVRLAVCGNPIQLSLFQEIEIRDLAYAGKRKLEILGVVPPKRDAQILQASDVRGLDLPPDTEILIPPTVRHEIGADGLAMMIQTGMLNKEEVAIATDYGTNAEMALISKGVVYTGSTAAGPAIEGQQLTYGLLALPGAISDVQLEDREKLLRKRSKIGTDYFKRLKTFVLDSVMRPRPGDIVDPETGRVIDKGEVRAKGITGTGVIALIDQGLRSGLIRLPKISTADKKIHLPDGVEFSEKDLKEAGKAIGSIKAGHITLCQEAGIRHEDVETAYLSGASGTYVDAWKAQRIGMIPPRVKKIYQTGNTSLAMARDLVKNVDELWRMKEIAEDLRKHHCMFAESKTFEKIFILELSYWTEGLPLDQYQFYLKRHGFPSLAEITDPPQVIKTVGRDIPDLGLKGLRIIHDIGEKKYICFKDCLGCQACLKECPEKALSINEGRGGFTIKIDLALCNGIACRRCETACNEKTFDLVKLITSESSTHPPPGEN
jgi:methylamine methyltransferase corrinoid protein reductive activase